MIEATNRSSRTQMQTTPRVEAPADEEISKKRQAGANVGTIALCDVRCRCGLRQVVEMSSREGWKS